MATPEKIKVAIIDDEPGCISNLQYYFSKYCPLFHVTATGNSADEALEILQHGKFDIAFLDIQLDKTDVFHVLEQAKARKFEIVFVTAFENYALKAVKAQALDYLLKPLLRTEVLACYQKILNRYSEKKILDTESSGNTKVLLRQGDKVLVVKLADIYYLKASGVYTQVLFDKDDKITSMTLSKPIGELEKDYDNSVFYRVHKSYLINYKKVKEVIKGEPVMIKMQNNTLIPVAKRRIHEFMSFLNH